MILHNSTVSLDHSIAEQWVEWMKAYYIPKTINSGLVEECRLCKIRGKELLEITYSVQIICKNDKVMGAFMEGEGSRMNTEMERVFKGQFAYFNTVLEVVHVQT